MDEKRFTMRMDQAIYDKIEKIAADNSRSVAKEIQIAISFYIAQVHYNRAQDIASKMPDASKEEFIDYARKVQNAFDDLIKCLR